MKYEEGFNKEEMALKYGVCFKESYGFQGYAVIADMYGNTWMCEGLGNKIIYTPMKTDVFTARIILALKTSKSYVAETFVKKHILFYNDGSFSFTINARDAERILKQEFFYKEELLQYCIEELGYSLDPHSEDYSHELRWFMEE